MAVLRSVAAIATAAAAISGCYTPALRDCTVSCSTAADCSGDQLCGSDGLCAAPDVAGTCERSGMVPSDAAVPPIDAVPEPDAVAPPVDAAMPAPLPDAPGPPGPPPTMATLRVQIDGKGTVIVDGSGTCSAGPGGRGDCSYQIPLRVAQTVRALPLGFDQRFVAWNSPTCRGAGPTCTFTPTASVTIVAKFDKAP